MPSLPPFYNERTARNLGSIGYGVREAIRDGFEMDYSDDRFMVARKGDYTMLMDRSKEPREQALSLLDDLAKQMDRMVILTPDRGGVTARESSFHLLDSLRATIILFGEQRKGDEWQQKLS